MNKIVQIEDIVPIIEEQLKSGGKVSFTPRGTSMLPLFRDNVDTVILATPEFTLKKYNIVFYRRNNGQYILHRIVKVQKDSYKIRKKETEDKETPVLKQTKEWLDLYFVGKEPEFLPPLAPEGSEFQKKVWKILLMIPYGKTMTYGEIGRKVAEMSGKKTMSAQAVGGAVGHNPISILIPCHRVVGTNGSLTGYAGGIEKKIGLLKLERTDMSGMFVPKKGTAL